MDNAKATISLYESIMQTSKSFVYRCENDADYTMRFLSGCFHDITGYFPEQIMENRERGYTSLCHPDDLNRWWPKSMPALKRVRHGMWIIALSILMAP